MHNTYILNLSEEEKDALVCVLQFVGGCPENSPRRFIRSICAKLNHVAVFNEKCSEGYKRPRYFKEVENKSSIIFNDFPASKTPQQLRIDKLEKTIKEAQKQLEELKGM